MLEVPPVKTPKQSPKMSPKKVHPKKDNEQGGSPKLPPPSGSPKISPKNASPKPSPKKLRQLKTHQAAQEYHQNCLPRRSWGARTSTLKTYRWWARTSTVEVNQPPLLSPTHRHPGFADLVWEKCAEAAPLMKSRRMPK